MTTTTTFVVGATGATGKHVVAQLLEMGHAVKVVVRSKERMENSLPKTCDTSKLTMTEASFLDLTDAELQDQLKDCTAAVSCLGHNLTFSGMYGSQDKGLVTNSYKRLTKAIETSNPTCKLICMGTDGVSFAGDKPRSYAERIVLCLLRYLVPPHADNEGASAFLVNYGSDKTMKWCYVRPTDLIDGDVTHKYTIYDHPPGGLFGSGVVTRANVAAFMVKLIIDAKAWEQYKFQMPVVHDIAEEDSKKQK